VAEYEKWRKKELKRIKRKEMLKQSHRKVGHVLNPGRSKGGIHRVDIPQCELRYDKESCDPSQWEGSWTSVCNPDEVAHYVCQANAKQYHQAHNTPFGNEPLLSLFVYHADTPATDAMTQGVLPSASHLKSLLPETIIYPRGTSPTPFPPVSAKVTTEAFQGCYKAMSEHTSSSPSGRLWSIIKQFPLLTPFLLLSLQ
jgi:hypothetical protein